jgi:hypothetical protein
MRTEISRETEGFVWRHRGKLRRRGDGKLRQQQTQKA